jgi:Flp pilus assembly protein TadG
MKRLRRDDGMVTAELATALPVLVLLALVAVMIVGIAQARVRCADAAREAARAVARGDRGAADRLARAAAGRPIAIQQASGRERTTVTVSLTLHPLRWLGPITVSETAVVATEPVS